MRTLLALFLALGLSAPGWAAAPPGFVETSYSSSALSQATGMAWAPDGSGRLFITRKQGEVRIVRLKDGALETQAGNNTLVTSVFATETVYTNSECGLIGIAFDPNYTVNRYVYFFITASATEQQIIRYTDANSVGTARTVLVRNLPTAGQNHDGGGIGFGPDGKLYWAIGDNGNGTGVDNDLVSMASKVSRANLDGTPVNDNPFYDGVGPNSEYVWARGFRNPFTLMFQPSTGKLWVNTVGTGYEQVFVVSRGDHAGYNDYENNQPAGYITPVVKYRTNGTDTRNLTATGASRVGGVATFTATARTGFRKGEKLSIDGVTDTSFNGDFFVTSTPSDTTFTVAQPGPDATSGNGSATTQALGGALSGGAFYDATLFAPEYRGNFFFGDYNSGQITRVTLAADNSVATVDEWTSGVSQALDLEVGPDGALYSVGHSSGAVRRYTPQTVTQKLVVTGLNLRVVEGGRATFSVRLAQAPAADVTVSVARASGDADLTVEAGASLTFTPANWAVPQTVTLAAAVDADADADTATFTVATTLAGVTAETVKATSIDGNGARLVLSTAALSVAEGGTGSFTVALSASPGATVTATVARTAGDADITVSGGASLTFNTSNWNTPQTVTLAAAQDADNVEGIATITVALAGLDARTVTVTEADDEPLAPVITSQPITTAVVGNVYRYDVETQARPVATYALVSGPSGMTIDATTGVITWTPTAAGTEAVTVSASNGVNPDATQSFSIISAVDDGPEAVLTRPVDQERVSGASAEFYGDCVDDVGCVRAEFYVDGVLEYTDTRTDNHFHFGGEHNRWDTTGLSPGGHVVRFVVVDTAGQQAEQSVTVCVGDGSCEVGTPDAGTGRPDAGTGQPPADDDDSGCGCGAAPVAPLAWLGLAGLALLRRRARRD